MGRIIFLTLYLGLVSGRQPIELRVEPGIAAVRLELDGRRVAELTAPPWKTLVDFGSGLAPQQLVAVGFDKRGEETARAEQAVNIPRPVAESDVTVEGNAFEVRWQQRMNEAPRRVDVRLDGKALAVRQNRGKLPAVDMDRPHLLTATLDFTTGSSRVERVIGGTRPDTTGTELTATAVRRQGSAIPAALDGCFTVDGRKLRARAVEKPDALVIVVRNPNPHAAVYALGQREVSRSATDRLLRDFATLGSGTNVRLLWPVAQEYTGTDLPTAQLFASTGDFDMQSGGMLAHLLTDGRGLADEGTAMRLADAAAVAGVQAAEGAHRRAVIVVLDGSQDASRYAPADVRRYLANLGVPLFVWTLYDPQPEVAAAWGTLVNVSAHDKLRKATDAVKRELDSQRVVWLGTDPIHAIRADANATCGLALLAQP
jgi:hypothetical protein